MKYLSIWQKVNGVESLSRVYLDRGHEPIEINANGVRIGRAFICFGQEERYEWRQHD